MKRMLWVWALVGLVWGGVAWAAGEQERLWVTADADPEALIAEIDEAIEAYLASPGYEGKLELKPLAELAVEFYVVVSRYSTLEVSVYREPRRQGMVFSFHLSDEGEIVNRMLVVEERLRVGDGLNRREAVARVEVALEADGGRISGLTGHPSLGHLTHSMEVRITRASEGGLWAHFNYREIWSITVRIDENDRIVESSHHHSEPYLPH